MRYVAVGIAIAIVALTPLARAEAADELHVEGKITSYLARDLDGDGRRELFVAHHENDERLLALFRARPGGTREPLYARAPDRVIPVDPRAVMFAVGDFTSPSGGELLFLSAASGVVVPLADGARPQRLFQADMFLSMPSVEDFPPWLSREPLDIDGDGLEDCIVAERQRLRILMQRAEARGAGGANDGDGPDGPLRWREAVLPVQPYYLVTTRQARVQEFVSRFVNDRRARAPLIDVTSTFPCPLVVDFDGDGLRDIVVKQESFVLEVYRQTPAGTFRSRPAVRTGIGWSSDATSVLLHDVSGDGRADLVATEIALEELSTDVSVYVQDPGAEDQGFSTPRQVIRTKGIFAAPTLADADGDGRADLLIASYRVDLLEQIRAAVIDRVEISFQIYPAGTDSPFARRPEFQRAFSLSTREVDATNTRPYLFAGSDLTGDGRTDVLWIDSHQDLRLYRAIEKRFQYEEDAAFRLRVAEPLEVELLDLDGEAGAEAVLRYERRLEIHRWGEGNR